MKGFKYINWLMVGVLIILGSATSEIYRSPVAMFSIHAENNTNMASTGTGMFGYGAAEKTAGSRGIVIPYDCTLVGLSGCFRTSCTGGATIKLDTNGVSIDSDVITHGSGVYTVTTTGIDIDLSAGTYVQFNCTSVCSAGGDGWIGAAFFVTRIDKNVINSPFD